MLSFELGLRLENLEMWLILGWFLAFFVENSDFYPEISSLCVKILLNWCFGVVEFYHCREVFKIAICISEKYSVLF